VVDPGYDAELKGETGHFYLGENRTSVFWADTRKRSKSSLSRACVKKWESPLRISAQTAGIFDYIWEAPVALGRGPLSMYVIIAHMRILCRVSDRVDDTCSSTHAKA
jgi:hypothetical protein